MEEAVKTKKKSIFKILAIIAAVFVLLFVIVAALIIMNLGSLIRKGVEIQGPLIAGVPVKLAGVDISILGASVEIKGLQVGNPEGFSAPEALSLSKVFIDVETSSVLSDKIVIERILIEDPSVTYEQTLSTNNFSKIQSNVNRYAEKFQSKPSVSPEKKTDGSSSSSEPAKEKKFLVKVLDIKGGSVNFSAKILGGKSLSFPLVDVHAENIGYDKDGVSATELSVIIFDSLTKSVLKAVSEGMSGTKGLLNKAADGATDSVDGVKKKSSELIDSVKKLF